MTPPRFTRTLSICSMLEISLRICCCTLATRRGFAMHLTRSGVILVDVPLLTACVLHPFPPSATARDGHRSERRAPPAPGSPAHIRGVAPFDVAAR